MSFSDKDFKYMVFSYLLSKGHDLAAQAFMREADVKIGCNAVLDFPLNALEVLIKCGVLNYERLRSWDDPVEDSKAYRYYSSEKMCALIESRLREISEIKQLPKYLRAPHSPSS